MRLIFVRVDTRDMSEPTSTEYLEQVRDSINPALEESFGKDITLLVTNLDLEFLSKENLQNIIKDFQQVAEKM